MQAATAVWTWSFHQKTFIIWKCMFRIFSFSLSHSLSFFISIPLFPTAVFCFAICFSSIFVWCVRLAWFKITAERKMPWKWNGFNEMFKCVPHIFHFSQVGVEGGGVFSSSFSWWLLLLSLASLYLENSLEKLVSREKVFGWLFFQKYHK